MNIETINFNLETAQGRNPELFINPPGSLTIDATADNLIHLLQTMYTHHAISHNRDKVIADLENGNLLTWFASKKNQILATASLVRQSPNGWELGRCVSLDRGNGVGKTVIMAAAKHHWDKHVGEPLVAEVRVADEFEGIPSGEATQRIFLNQLELVPHALAPLFSHGNPLRHEPFVLTASNLDPQKTISQQIAEAINNRSLDGIISRVKQIQSQPFRLIVPDNNGTLAETIVNEDLPTCTLFVIEATDSHMPLIGMLSTNPNMVVCGIDRNLGVEGKPVVLIATIGTKALLAPAKISETLTPRHREDLQHIADSFHWS